MPDMLQVDCFKGLIGFTDDNDCLPNIPGDLTNTSLSGLFMDKHPLFSNMIVKGPNQNWSAEKIWDHIRQSDLEARIELAKLIGLEIREKVTPYSNVRHIELGENRGSGYYSDFTIPANGQFQTRNVPDAVFLLTNIGIRGRLIGNASTATVHLYKNNTLLTGWLIPIEDQSNTRTPLTTPYQIPLDGATYRFEYNFPSGFFPVKNPMGCGCIGELEKVSCFFMPWQDNTDMGGLRLLGEISCNESIWPCELSKSGLVGMLIASLYRGILVSILVRRLHSSLAGKINGLTLIPEKDKKANFDALALEITNNLSDFKRVWKPVNSCCWSVKTLAELGSL